ncbi:MAG: CRTAC1 family protein [Acidobacteriota bacterium]|nr:CRTAC1 family protein [Acidobacteriota bacterium]
MKEITRAALLFVAASTVFSICLIGDSQHRAVSYQDVTAQSGIHFEDHNSPTPEKYLIETMTGGVALFDYDNDGFLDIYVVNGARIHPGQSDNEAPDKSMPEYWNRLYHNNRDGTFTDVTEKAGVRGKGYGMGVAVADYDNDGFEDLLVTNFGSVILYHNNGNGTFTDVTAKAGLQTSGWMSSAGFFDYDNDGKLDLFICRYLDWNFSKNIYCGSKEAGGRAYCHPDNFKPVSNYLFHNNGDGTFSDVSAKSHIAATPGKALGVAFGDFNNDGRLDISVANDSFPQFVFLNNGDGTFSENGVAAGVAFTDDGKTFAGMGTDVADVDDDGKPDIVTTALSNETYAYFHNVGDGMFNYDTNVSRLGEITRLYGGWGMRIFDYDNDGAKDLFFANSHVMDNVERTQPHIEYMERLLLLRQVDRKFVNVSAQSGSVFEKKWASRGAAFGDVDNDGDIDIVVVTCGGPLYVLRNEGGNINGWIGIDLRGTRSNRDGIGAKIKLISESGKVQYGMVTTTASYQSAQDKRLYFGVGQEKSIRKIEISWPSGTKQTIPNPRLRKILAIEETSTSEEKP